MISARFAVLEHRQGEHAVDQALEGIETDLNQLATSTHDYAVWDDAARSFITKAADCFRNSQ